MIEKFPIGDGSFAIGTVVKFVSSIARRWFAALVLATNANRSPIRTAS
jgi:hypothetical protein